MAEDVDLGTLAVRERCGWRRRSRSPRLRPTLPVERSGESTGSRAACEKVPAPARSGTRKKLEMTGQERDYYSLLGVGRDASGTDIDRAYRRAARETHPDINPEDSSAAERFNAVTIAYETLRNPGRRASYDRPGVRARKGMPVSGRRGAHAAGPPPVHLGRPPGPERLEIFRIGDAAPVDPVADDLLELVTTLSRLLNGWPFR
jgi:hypothetical protein